jgi:hypothetical protein
MTHPIHRHEPAAPPSSSPAPSSEEINAISHELIQEGLWSSPVVTSLEAQS